jgi:hypothetical protein
VEEGEIVKYGKEKFKKENWKIGKIENPKNKNRIKKKKKSILERKMEI